MSLTRRSSSARIACVAPTWLAVASAAALATLLVPARADAQILYNTAPYSAGFPASTAAAISAFDGLTMGGSNQYGCTSLTTLDGVHNSGEFGSDSDIAYHESAIFTVAPSQVGQWAFRWGPDFGWGGTLLVDGTVLEENWANMWWSGAFTDPTQYLQGTITLGAGTHIVEVFGFEDCCDGAMDAQFMAPGGMFMDITSGNLTLSNGPACGTPGVLLTESTSAATAAAGTSVNFTFFLDSIGSVAAPGAVLTTALPPNTMFGSATGTGAAATGGTYDPTSGNVTWTLGSLGSGVTGTATLTVTIGAPLANGTTIANSATLTATGATTATSSASVTVTSAPVLSLSDTPASTSAAAGAPLTYTLGYSNTGTDVGSGVVITWTLPANVTFQTADTSGVYDSTANAVTWTLGTIPAGTTNGAVSATVLVASPLANGTSLTDAASLTATNAATLVANSTVMVTSSAVLSLTETGAPNPVAAGGQLVYTLNYGNNGTDTANTAVLVAAVPANTAFASSPTGAFDGTSNVTFALGNVTAGTSGSVSFTVQVASPLANATVLSASASLSATGVASAPAMAMTTVDSAPTLSLTNTGAPNPVLAGSQLTYTLAYANNGTDTAHAAMLTDPLPAGAAFVSASNSGAYDSGANQVLWSLGDLAAAGSGSVTVTVTVGSSTPAETLSDTATLAASNVTTPITATAMTMVNSSVVADAGASDGSVTGGGGAPSTGGGGSASTGAGGTTSTGAGGTTTTGTGGTTSTGAAGSSGAGGTVATGAGGSLSTTGSGGASSTTTGAGGTTATGAGGSSGTGVAGSGGTGVGGATGAGGAGATGTAGSAGTGTGNAGGSSSTGAGAAGGTTGTTGAGGTGGTTNTTGAGGHAGAPAGGASGGTSTASNSSSGCDCAVGAAPSPSSLLWMTPVLGLIVVRRRRTRR